MEIGRKIARVVTGDVEKAPVLPPVVAPERAEVPSKEEVPETPKPRSKGAKRKK